MVSLAEKIDDGFSMVSAGPGSPTTSSVHCRSACGFDAPESDQPPLAIYFQTFIKLTAKKQISEHNHFQARKNKMKSTRN